MKGLGDLRPTPTRSADLSLHLQPTCRVQETGAGFEPPKTESMRMDAVRSGHGITFLDYEPVLARGGAEDNAVNLAPSETKSQTSLWGKVQATAQSVFPWL